MAKTAGSERLDEVADWLEAIAKDERSHVNRSQRTLNDSMVNAEEGVFCVRE